LKIPVHPQFVAFGLVAKQHIIAGDTQWSKAAQLMARRQDREEDERLASLYHFQGRAPND
jgi:hypothetical protein